MTKFHVKFHGKSNELKKKFPTKFLVELQSTFM